MRRPHLSSVSPRGGVALAAVIAIGASGPITVASACCKPAPRQTPLTPLVLLSSVTGLEIESLDVDLSVSRGRHTDYLDADYLIEEVVVNSTDKDIATRVAAFWCKSNVEDFDCEHFHASVSVDGRSVDVLRRDLSTDDNQESVDSTLELNGVFNLVVPAKGRATITIKGWTPPAYYGHCGATSCPRFVFSVTEWPFPDLKFKPFQSFGRYRVGFSWTEKIEREYRIEVDPKPDRSRPGLAEWSGPKGDVAPSYGIGLNWQARKRSSRGK